MFVKTDGDTFFVTNDCQRKSMHDLIAEEVARGELVMKEALELVDAASEPLSPERAANSSKGGGKLSRSETVTVRLDPKLRYLAELAARLHRRTLSSYVEWAIKTAIDSEAVRPANTPGMVATDRTIGNEAEYLWDVDEADRFAKLAFRYPHLLTHEEQVRWKLVRECGYLWRGSYAGYDETWTWMVREESLIFERLRQHWIAFCRVADTGTGREDLPTWQERKVCLQPPPGKNSTATDLDAVGLSDTQA